MCRTPTAAWALHGPRLALALLVAAGCSWNSGAGTRPEAARPLGAPDAVVDVSASRAPPLRFGAPVAAELSSVAAAMEAQAQSVRATFVLLPDAPAGEKTPLDDRVDAVVDADTAALELTAELARESFLLEGVSATELLAEARATIAADVCAALPRDVSVRVGLRSERPGAREPSSGSAREAPAARSVVEVAVVLRRDGADELEWTLELSRGKREILLLERRTVASSRRLAIVVRSPFSTTNGPDDPWLAVAIEIAPSPASSRALAALEASLAAERAERGRGGARPPARGARETAAVDVAALRTRFEAAPRQTLAELGRGEGAVVALEAALTLPDAAFRPVAASIERALARRAVASRATSPSHEPLSPLGLDVDVAALEVLLSRELRASSRGLVERLFGAAFLPDLADAPQPLFPRVRLASDRGELERLVMLANLVALDSSRPSVRVRAARFLAPLAPGLEGYDPFETLERRSESVGRLWTRLSPAERRP